MERPEIPSRLSPEATTNDPWVRELSPRERASLAGLGTGAVLPDGAVVLREDDIDRMGLRTLRTWLVEHAFAAHQPIALVPRASRRFSAADEDDEQH